MVAIMNATSGSKLRLASKCLPSLPRRSIALLPRTSVPVAHKTIAQASHSSSGPSRFDVLNAAVLATEPQGSSPWAGVKAWLVRIAQTVAIMLVAMALVRFYASATFVCFDERSVRCPSLNWAPACGTKFPAPSAQDVLFACRPSLRRLQRRLRGLEAAWEAVASQGVHHKPPPAAVSQVSHHCSTGSHPWGTAQPTHARTLAGDIIQLPRRCCSGACHPAWAPVPWAVAVAG